jgi:hypothetical protein
MTGRRELTDRAWAVIEPLLSPVANRAGNGVITDFTVFICR